MARDIRGDATIGQMKGEIDHTEDMLEAEGLDEQAQRIPGWRGMIEELEQKREAHRRRRSKMEARRRVASWRLKTLSRKFGKKLLGAVDQDRQSPVWRSYFSMAPSLFHKEPVPERVRVIRNWLLNPHPALEPFRADLTLWCTRAEEALAEEVAISSATKLLQGEGDDVAARLTALRNELHRELAAMAAGRGEEEDWADEFFLVG